LSCDIFKLYILIYSFYKETISTFQEKQSYSKTKLAIHQLISYNSRSLSNKNKIMSKHKIFLKEFCKLLTGLVIGDLIGLIWFYNSSLLPINFLGAPFTKPMAIIAMLFDAVLIMVLAHYAWKAEIHAPDLHQKTFFYFVGTVFGIVSILHLLRLIFGIDVTLGSWMLPIWMSWLGTVVTGYLSYASFHFAQTSKK